MTVAQVVWLYHVISVSKSVRNVGSYGTNNLAYVTKRKEHRS